MTAYSFYDGNVVAAKHALTALKGLITKAEEHQPDAAILKARLIEDMNPLSFQVHISTSLVEESIHKLLDTEYTKPADDLDTYAKCHARIDRALEGLSKLDREQVDTRCEQQTDFDFVGRQLNLPVKGIVGQLYLPNVYFHVITAYSILRKEGVPIGKRDWLMPFVGEYLQ